jgi:hypothetical protein
MKWDVVWMIFYRRESTLALEFAFPTKRDAEEAASNFCNRESVTVRSIPVGLPDDAKRIVESGSRIINRQFVKPAGM